MLGFRQRSLHPAARRLRQWLLNHFSNLPPRRQGVYLVTHGTQRFKRLVLPDSHSASTIAENLRTFGSTEIYPSLIFERENELWVEFIEGQPIPELDEKMIDEFARLFAVLYSRDARRVASDRTAYNHVLHTDLRFLWQVGVLGDALYRELDKRADALTPSELWVGYDCSDAILKNFLLCPDGRIRGIDCESLSRDQLLGTGVAKAGIRWLGPWRGRFLEQLAARSAPDFIRYMPFIELSFLAFWTKSSFLEKKHRFVDPGRFERFLAHPDPGDGSGS